MLISCKERAMEGIKKDMMFGTLKNRLVDFGISMRKCPWYRRLMF